MRILTYTATPQDAGHAVRSVVPRRFSLGEHAYRRLKAQNAIRIDGQSVRADRIVQAGETIELLLPSSDTSGGAAASSAAANGEAAAHISPPSYLRYRDEDLLIVSKGAPLATLPNAYLHANTLREQVIAMLGADPASFCYHPVNRLDKGTSGLLCIALHAHAQRLLAAQLHTGSFLREYLAVTEGVPAQAEGVIDAPIARLGAGARRGIRPDGQHAVTHYRVEGAQNGRALLRLRLETGRTHQIRVHLASIDCPIVGDYLYGRELPELDGRFALHSALLRCTHPITGEPITCNEPLPRELSALLKP